MELRSTLLADVAPHERFVVELLLREALLNAVVHGSYNDSGKSVRCLIKKVAGGVRIWVADSGDGFDWRNRRLERETPLTPSGHGLHILQLYASRIRFNAKGNRLELMRQFDEGERQ
jgi:anti-sigma regulatory factor (Ser/Thr protein kinase)